MTIAVLAPSSSSDAEETPARTQQRAPVSAKQGELFAKYPLFFRAVAALDVQPSNLRNFGIQCGAGWYPLLEEAAALIEDELVEARNQLVQWDNIAALEHAVLMQRTDRTYPVLPLCTDIQQVKGVLAIVIVQGFISDPALWQRIVAIVDETKEKSRSICESCGAPGKMRPLYWRHVYCEECISPIGPVD